MTDTRQIADLFFRLRGTASPARKLRLVLQAWRALRAMSPAERRRVAKELGFEGAEGVVDRIAAQRDGVPRELLEEALRRAGSTDPADVERLAGDLRRAEGRKGAVQRGLHKLESLLVHGTTATEEARLLAHLATEDDGAAAATRGEPPPAPDAVEQEANGSVRNDAGLQDERPPRTEGAAVPAEVAVAATGTGSAEPEARAEEPTAAPGDVDVRAAGSLAGSARAGRPAAAPEVPRRSEPARGLGPSGGRTPRRRTRTEPSRHEVRTDPVRADAFRGLWNDLGSPQTLAARLRLLRERAGELHGLARGDLQALLERFPDGWARRRALVALLEAGVPDETGDALALIAALGTRSARRWCLATLRRTHGVAEGAWLEHAARLGVPGPRRASLPHPSD